MASLTSVGNKLALAGLVASGLLMLAGMVLHRGDVAGLGSYFGWFFGLYSALAYLFASARFAWGRLKGFWSSLYPVNFGLTIIGVSAFGFHTSAEVPFAILSAVIAVLAAFLLHRFSRLTWKPLPIGMMGLLLVPAMESLREIWAFLYVFVGTLFIVTALTQKWDRREDGSSIRVQEDRVSSGR